MKLSAALKSEAAAMTTLTAETFKPKSLVSVGGGGSYFLLVSGSRQGREQALRQDNVYILSYSPCNKQTGISEQGS